MKFIITAFIFLAFSLLSFAQISMVDRDTLFANLKLLEKEWVQSAVNTCNSLFSKTGYTTEDWTGAFREYYSKNPFSSSIRNYIGYPTFFWLAEDARLKLQSSQKAVFLEKIAKLLETENLDIRLGTDAVFNDELFTILGFLESLANQPESMLPDSSKSAIYLFSDYIIRQYPQYYSRKISVDPGLSPYRALIGLQFQITLLNAFPPDESRIQYLGDLFQLREPYLKILRNHQLYIADNNRMSSADLDFLDRFMQVIPDTLTRLRVMTHFESYYTGTQGRKHVELSGRGSVNVFSTLGGYMENGFPNDVSELLIDGFSVVVAHEVNHRIDPDYIYPNPSLSARRAQLVNQAGTEDLQYLRSMVGGRFFQAAPQEFIASIANQWFSSSEHTLRLGLNRFDKGYREPLNQVLYFCELYSLGRDSTRFYSIDTRGNIRLELIKIGRNDRGCINQLQVKNRVYSFETDSSCNVTRYESILRTSMKAKVPVSIRLYPNPARDILYILSPQSEELKVTDIQGKLWLKAVPNRGPIDVSALPPGLYFIMGSKPSSKFEPAKFVKQ